MSELKIFFANSNKEWDEHHSLAVVAETEQEARKIIDAEFGGFTDYSFDVSPIVKGLKINVSGYDDVSIYPTLPEPEGK